MIQGKLLDVKEVSALCHISKAQVYRLIHSDPTFPVIKISNKFLFDQSEVQQWIEHRKTVTLRGVMND